MSDLTKSETSYFEQLFQMSGGYVLDFSDRTFGNFFERYNIDIHADKYQDIGTSKAKKLRSFWRSEPNEVVAEVLTGLVRVYENGENKVLWGPYPEDLNGAKLAISRLENKDRNSSRNKSFFLASFTISISDASFSDFIKQSGNSNTLNNFLFELAELETRLEAMAPKPLNLPLKFKRDSTEIASKGVTLSHFHIINITYSEGSVVAKVQIGCKVVAGATAFLAAYPVAKDGYLEIRADLQHMSSGVFNAIENNAPAPPVGENKVNYYFLKPETIEENLNRLINGDAPLDE